MNHKSIQCIIFIYIIICHKYMEVNSYSKVFKTGALNTNTTDFSGATDTIGDGGGSDNEGPKIHHAAITDLIFPRVLNKNTPIIEEDSIYRNSNNNNNNDGNNNESDELISPEKEESTGRASKYSRPFQFPSFNPASIIKQPLSSRTRPYSPEYSTEYKQEPTHHRYPVYRPPPLSRTEIDKLNGKGQAMDRYTPGEAVATSFYKKNNNKNGNGYMYKQAPKMETPLSPSLPPLRNDPDLYIPPKDLYSFPPNSEASYPIPSKSSNMKIQPGISSYLPPPAGPIDSYNGGFVGPINPEYLPPYLKNPPSPMMESDDMDKGKSPPDANENSSGKNGNHQMDMLNEDKMPSPLTPQPPRSQSSMNSDISSMEDQRESSNEDMMMPIPTRSPPQSPQMPPMPIDAHFPISDDEDHNGHEDNDHHHHGKDMPDNHDHHHTEDMPDDQDHHHGEDIPDDHDHHHHDHDHPHDQMPWNSLPSFFSGHSFDTFPEIIYDDHHHHHHHGIPPEILTTTTTERPEPRVKKYSYFYLGRKLWYIPLYFTVWFSFYILFLILKSIARHKVNLPNHYTSRRSMMKRAAISLIPYRDSSINHHHPYSDYSHRESVEQINRLTASVMEQIEAFKEKYL